jgi:hypothetical protein
VIEAAVVTLLATFPIFALASRLIFFRPPSTHDRGRRSPPFLAAAAIVLVGVTLFAVPWPETNASMARRIVYPPANPGSGNLGRALREDRDGLERALIRELHRYPLDRARRPDSEDNRGLKHALQVISSPHRPDAVAELRSWVRKDVADDVRLIAAGELLNCDSRTAPEVVDLFRELERGSSKERACEMVLSRGRLDQVPALAQAIREMDQKDQRCKPCLQCFWRFGPAAQVTIVELAERGRPSSRLDALGVLSAHGGWPPAWKAQLDGLRDPEVAVRRESCTSLFQTLRNLEGEAAVVQAVGGDPDACGAVDTAAWPGRAELIRRAVEEFDAERRRSLASRPVPRVSARPRPQSPGR